MLLKRIIPCLDVDQGRVVKGTNFVDIRDAGDPVELAAVFELLTEFGGMKKSQARTWIKEHIGAGKKVTENASAAVNIMALENFEQPAEHARDASPTEAYRRQRYLDLLLHTAGSLRKFVVGSVVLK
jgi:hypothetical protein